MRSGKLPFLTLAIDLLLEAFYCPTVAHFFDPAKALANDYGVQLAPSSVDSTLEGSYAGEDTPAEGEACPLVVGALLQTLTTRLS